MFVKWIFFIAIIAICTNKILCLTYLQQNSYLSNQKFADYFNNIKFQCTQFMQTYVFKKYKSSFQLNSRSHITLEESPPTTSPSLSDAYPVDPIISPVRYPTQAPHKKKIHSLKPTVSSDSEFEISDDDLNKIAPTSKTAALLIGAAIVLTICIVILLLYYIIRRCCSDESSSSSFPRTGLDGMRGAPIPVDDIDEHELDFDEYDDPQPNRVQS